MASGTNIKDYLWQIIVGTVSTVLGGILLALNWSAVKSFFGAVAARVADVGAWLIGTTEVYRVAMITDFAVLAAFALGALWWHQSRAHANAPVVAPVVSPPRVPADFKPTRLQVSIILVLMQRWQQQTTLQNVSDGVEQVHPEQLPELMVKAHIARELELLEALNVVSIDRVSTNYAYYHLTPLGRDWAIQAMKSAKEKIAPTGS